MGLPDRKRDGIGGRLFAYHWPDSIPIFFLLTLVAAAGACGGPTFSLFCSS
jgi:hypothetical protein